MTNTSPQAYRHLILMRHAEAEPSNRAGNLRRRLVTEGHRQAFAAATALKNMGLVPGQVIVSPATRTQETLTDMIDAWGTRPQTITDQRLFDISHGLGAYRSTDIDLELEFSAILDQADPRQTCVMVLGHNPAIANLVHKIGTRLPYELTVGYPSATATVLRISGDWNKLANGSHECAGVVYNGTRAIAVSPRHP